MENDHAVNVQANKSVDEIFAGALDLGPEQRAAYLAQACRGDDELRSEVENLLRCASDAPDFLEHSLEGISPGYSDALFGTGGDQPAVPARVGKFEILGELGAGGMGIVYRARSDSPRRDVALKLVRTGWASAEILRRFEYEAQVLARLKHAGIAQIYETGTAETGHGRQPYFAMELVDGPPLSEYVRGRSSTRREKLELVAQVCDAIQHAHQRGVIHRDLKPANILVDAAGQPKVLDFGVARLRDEDRPDGAASMHTVAGQLLGTLAYMSPEQVAGDPAAIDARADVYAIGVMLYELLSGALPHDIGSLGLSDALRVLREQEPRRLSIVDPALGGDLEVIVGRATAREAGVRYQSAAELAGDIRRYLADQPVLARRPSLAYVARKFIARNRSLVIAAGIAVGGLVVAALAMFWRAGVVASGLALASMLAGIGATLWQADRAKRAAAQATHEAARAGSEALRASEAAGRAMKESDRANAEALRASEQASVAEAVSRHLSGLLESANPDISKKKDVTLREMLDRSTPESLARDFDGNPRVLARLHGVIGRSYEALGELDRAEEHYRGEFAVAESRLGEHGREMVDALNDLGHLHKLRDRFDESEAMLRRAVSLSRQNLGETDSLAIGCKINLASLLQRREAYVEAEELLRESTDAALRSLGESHRTTHVSMNNLASAMKGNGKFKEAIEMHRRFLQLVRRTFGDANTGTIIAINNLAKDMLDGGDAAGAEPLFREALALRESLLGKGHRSTLNSRCNLGACLAARGEVEEAARILRDVVDQASATIESGNIERAKFEHEYGQVLAVQGELVEAERQLLSSHAAYASALGAGSRKARGVARSLAGLYEAWNKPQDALTWGEAGRS